MLLGILRVKDSLGEKVASARGLDLEQLREKLRMSCDMAAVVDHDRKLSSPILEEFLTGLKSQNADYLISFFAAQAQIVDVHGRRWTRDELEEDFESVFAPYAKKNATYIIEETIVDTTYHLVAVALWKNALVASPGAGVDAPDDGSARAA